MKKTLLTLSCIAAISFTAAADDFVYEYEGQKIVYTVIDEEAKTCRTKAGSSEFDYETWQYLNEAGNVVSGDLILPANPRNGDVEYTLVALGEYSFLGCDGLLSIDIPASVTEIGDCAFEDCKGLVKSSFADMKSLLGISFVGGASANPIYYSHNLFIGGEEVTTPVIPEGTEAINDNVFAGLSSMKTIEIPSSVTSIGKGAFHSCTSLEKVTVPEGVTSIGMGAFMFCSALSSIELPASLVSVGGYCFYECDALTKSDFGSIESLCSIDFADTYSNPLRLTHNLYIAGEEVKDVVIPVSVKEIKNYAFYEANFITSVSMSDSVESIGLYGFNHCYNMKWIKLSSALSSIGQAAFEGCPALVDVLIPPSVTSVGSNAFNNCSGILKSAYPDHLAENPFLVKDPWSSDYFDFGGITFTYDASKASVIDGVIYLDAMTTVKYVSANIGSSFVVPAGVVYIADNAFAFCEGLEEVVLSEDLLALGDNVFRQCPNIKAVECCTTMMAPTAMKNCFMDDVYKAATLYVPVGTKDMYASAVCWKEFSNIVEGSIAGVEVVDAMDFNAPFEIFRLDGIRVKGNVEDLHPGIYIVRQGNASKKITIF